MLPAASPVRFGAFEVDLRAGELRKNGVKIKLQEQPLQVLVLLLERPGQVVTREELQRRLWSTDTFVDFEHSLNAAVKRLREALGDSADNPRFIETLPRHGYRFIAPVGGTEPSSRPRALVRHRSAWIATLIVAALAVILLGFNVGGWRQRVSSRVQEAPIRSLAVLPLENLSAKPEEEYFADGMTDELITELGKIRALRVISRQSVMRYKGTDKSLPQIARELNVDAVVEGSVLQSGGRVRITAQLVHATTDRHLWAESYENETRDVLVLQAKVARAIADEIQGKLQPEERARLATASPVNPEAYEAYLRGRLFYYRLTAKDLLKAIHYSQQAIQIDPGYAPAHALLAACYYDASRSRLGDVPDTEAAQKARATALKALELDSSLAAAHVVLGAVHDGVDWDWAGAEREFRRAIELDSNLVQAHAGLAWHLVFMRRDAEAIQEAKRAVELDPLSSYALFDQTQILYYTRHYDQAIEQARKLLEIYPDNELTYFWLVLAFDAKGMYDEEVAAREKSMTLEGEPADVVAGLGRAYKSSGILSAWRYELERVTRKQGDWRLYSSLINNRLGNTDKAIELIESLYADPARREAMFVVKFDPSYDNLRSDSRFQDILRRMNVQE